MSILPMLALRVMTYNVLYSNPDPQASLDAIAAADPDVVLLQEVTSRWEDALEKRFETQYPYRKFHIGPRAAGGIAVLSKMKITEDTLWAPPSGTGAWFPAQRVVLDSPLGPLQILNVHLRPQLDGGSWVRGFVTTPAVRLAEIEAHWKHIDPGLRTVVAGDFNEDPSSGKAVDFLTRAGLTRVVTSGPRTWHYDSFFQLDIDHVMIDSGLVATDAHVIDAGRSDHRPVIVTLAVR